MLATRVERPFHLPGWVYEEKYDGFRILAYKEGRRVALVSRNMKDRTADFPEVARAVAALPAPTLALDGEVIVLDGAGVSRFQLLQRRGQGGTGQGPIFAVFDCLYARDADLRKEPLTLRRRVLETEVREGPHLRLARRLDADGYRAFETAKRRRLEGLIAKDVSSLYLPGARTLSWRKVKIRGEEEFVVGGFTAPEGARAHLGAILVGAYEGPKLRYAGKVGTGFTVKTLTDLSRRFARIVRADSPFDDLPRERGVTWVEPRLVAQIGFTEMTDAGRLRHPTFLGLREDKAAREVRWSALTPRSDGGARPKLDGASAPAKGRASSRRPRSRRPARDP